MKALNDNINLEISSYRERGLTGFGDWLVQVSNRVPFLADLKPSGKYVMEDLQAVGGIPAVLKMLLEEGLIDGSCMTVTGR